MTVTTSVGRAGSHTAEITRRLRGKLAEEMITNVDVARSLGIPQQTFNRRMLGVTPFTVDEILDVADVTGLNVLWLLTGEGAPFGPRGPLMRARRDSNPQPSDPKVEARTGDVTQFPAGRRPKVHRLQTVSSRPVSTLPGTAA